jgi:hypothetical protein
MKIRAKTEKRQDASLPNRNIIIIGASGSGKSSFLREEVDFKQKRIIAWDPEEDYKLPRVRDMKTFKAICRKSGFGAIRVALTVNPTEENFEVFAAYVFAICHAKAPMDILTDEIADVTRVTKASPNWGQLCRKVRKYGGRLCAITQRPQECDKTIFNQVKFKWCGSLGSQASYKSMANEMDVPVNELKDLENIEQVQVQYWLREGTLPAEKHTISFKKKTPVKVKPATKKRKPKIIKKT